MFNIKKENCLIWGEFTEMNHSGLVSAVTFGTENGPLNTAGHTGQDPVFIKKNRDIFLSRFGIRPDKLFYMNQTHSSVCVYAGQDIQEKPDPVPGSIQADAAWTDRPGLALAVFTADCVPLTFYDPSGPAVLAVHAGWKGCHSGIIKKSLAEFSKRSGYDHSRIKAAIGPCIRSCCYEVSDDFRKYFQEKFLLFRNDSLYFDLYGACMEQVRESGILSENISGQDLCTHCSGPFLASYRKNQTPARMMTVIMLRKN